MQFGKFVDNSLTVGGIGHTEPAGVRIKYAYGSFSVVDKSVDAQGNEEFSFGRVDVAFEELDKFATAEIPRSSSIPECWVRGSALCRFRR